jgi:hypothetical protein
MARPRFCSVRLTEQERERLTEIAQEWQVPVSEVLRFTFRAFILGLGVADKPPVAENTDPVAAGLDQK